jgi:hypothetical protein
MLERDSQCRKLLGEPADPGAEDEPAAAEPVERRRGLRQHQRVVLGNETNPGAEPDRARACCRVGERRERIGDRNIGRPGKLPARIGVLRGVLFDQHHMLGRPQRGKAEALGGHRHGPEHPRLDRCADADGEKSDPHALSPPRAAMTLLCSARKDKPWLSLRGRRDEAISMRMNHALRDCFAALAMTLFV